MSQHIITGKTEAESMTSVTAPVLYRLSDAWQAHCHALNLEVSDVVALAAQGSVGEAHHRLLRLIAGTNTDASQTTQPSTAPFVSVPRPSPAGPVGGQSPAQHGAAAGAPPLSAASGAPTAGLEAAALSLVLRGQPASAAGKFRRFRPLVPSRFVVLPRLQQTRLPRTRRETAICLEDVLPGCFQ